MEDGGSRRQDQQCCCAGSDRTKEAGPASRTRARQNKAGYRQMRPESIHQQHCSPGSKNTKNLQGQEPTDTIADPPCPASLPQMRPRAELGMQAGRQDASVWRAGYRLTDRVQAGAAAAWRTWCWLAGLVQGHCRLVGRVHWQG